MNFNEYQEEAHKTVFLSPKLYLKNSAGEFIEVPYIYHGLGLGEAGEAQNKLKKIVRDADGVITEETKKAICGELGGILWYVAACAYDLGLTLDDVATGNIATLRGRQARGTLQGSGDDR